MRSLAADRVEGCAAALDEEPGGSLEPRARRPSSRSPWRSSDLRAPRPSPARARSSEATSSSRSGTTSLAAAVGVDARTSAARSQSGVSCSCPTALTTGTGQPATARTTRSSLNGSRSSKLPPPRARTTTSTSGSAQIARSASTTASAARGPCTKVSATRSCAGGKRACTEAITSRFAAASFPVTSPILRGKRGSGRLRSGANRPSPASFCFSRSSAARCSPSPNRSIPSARSRSSPRGSKSSGRPYTCTLSPFCRSSRSASNCPRGISPARSDPSPASLSVKKTLCQRSCRRSSEISPSTQTVGRRWSHEPMPRLNADTVYTRRSP